MRSPGVIYRRYRQIRRKILYDKLEESRKRLHKNCAYGKTVRITQHGQTYYLPICLFPFDRDCNFVDYEICNKPSECSAFARKYTKQDIEEHFEEELSDISVLREKYPELHAFEWVLDKTLNDATKNPGLVARILISAITFLENILKNTGGSQKTLGINK